MMAIVLHVLQDFIFLASVTYNVTGVYRSAHAVPWFISFSSKHIFSVINIETHFLSCRILGNISL